jgi:hypothetical protein
LILPCDAKGWIREDDEDREDVSRDAKRAEMIEGMLTTKGKKMA